MFFVSGLGFCGELVRGIFVIIDSSAGKLGICSVGDSSTVVGESSIFGAGGSSPGLQGETVVLGHGDYSLGLWGLWHLGCLLVISLSCEDNQPQLLWLVIPAHWSWSCFVTPHHY